MTDSNLMDANCVHGVAWYDCLECSRPQSQRDMDKEIERLVNQAKSSSGYGGAPTGYVSAQAVPLLLEAILIILCQIHDYQVNAGAPVETTGQPVEDDVRP